MKPREYRQIVISEVNCVPPRANMMEVMDHAKGEVWLSLDEVTPAQAEALQISPGLVKYRNARLIR